MAEKDHTEQSEVFDCVYNWWDGFVGKETCEAGYLICEEKNCPMYHKADMRQEKEGEP